SPPGAARSRSHSSEGMAAMANSSAQDYVPWVMLSTALLLAIAAIPSLLWLRERAAPGGGEVRPLFGNLLRAWRETRADFPDFRRLLLCIACYQAGITVVITLAAVYATEVMGFQMRQTMLLVFLVNIAA